MENQVLRIQKLIIQLFGYQLMQLNYVNSLTYIFIAFWDKFRPKKKIWLHETKVITKTKTITKHIRPFDQTKFF